MRETAVLGIPGIATLDFYVDSTLAGIRLDRVMLLVFIIAILNIGVDSLSRYIRSRLSLSNRVEQTLNKPEQEP
jgi:phosphonate transport system permease protein